MSICQFGFLELPPGMSRAVQLVVPRYGGQLLSFALCTPHNQGLCGIPAVFASGFRILGTMAFPSGTICHAGRLLGRGVAECRSFGLLCLLPSQSDNHDLEAARIQCANTQHRHILVC